MAAARCVTTSAAMPAAACAPLGELVRHVSAAPQLPQNREFGAAAVPHCVQCAGVGGAIATPQLEQNFAPGLFGA